MEEEKKNVAMSDEELREFEAFKADKEKKAREERDASDRKCYAQMVDEEIAAAIPELLEISGSIKMVKDGVLAKFKSILDLKAGIMKRSKGVEMDIDSHMFTNSTGTMRIMLGQCMIDSYLDTAEDGIRIIREYISSLATDAKSRALVGMVLKLLAKDAKGTLKAQRIIQLRKVADETGDEMFISGVKIIEEAYRPLPSKTFIRAYMRDVKTNEWKAIPLGMTES